MRTLLILAILGSAVSAGAYIEDVVVSPEQPEVGDVLYVTVQGFLSDSCWEMVGVSQEVVGQEIRVFVDLVDHWEPEFDCLTVITEYLEFFAFEDLAAGEYTLVVTETHDSLRQPDDQIITVPVVITGSVAAAQATWTQIKALYR